MASLHQLPVISIPFLFSGMTKKEKKITCSSLLEISFLCIFHYTFIHSKSTPGSLSCLWLWSSSVFFFVPPFVLWRGIWLCPVKYLSPESHDLFVSSRLPIKFINLMMCNETHTRGGWKKNWVHTEASLWVVFDGLSLLLFVQMLLNEIYCARWSPPTQNI